MFLDIKKNRRPGFITGRSVLIVVLLMFASGALAANEINGGRLAATGDDSGRIQFDVEGSVERVEVCFFDADNSDDGGCIAVDAADAVNPVAGLEDLVDGRIYGYFARVRFLGRGEAAISDTLYSGNSDVAVNFVTVNTADKPLAVAETVPRAHSYPNPFNPRQESATIVFSPAATGDITMIIYDLFGHLVYEETVSPASDLNWDGRNGRGELVAGGGYVCVLKMGDEVVSKHKIAVVKFEGTD